MYLFCTCDFSPKSDTNSTVGVPTRCYLASTSSSMTVREILLCRERKRERERERERERDIELERDSFRRKESSTYSFLSFEVTTGIGSLSLSSKSVLNLEA